LPLFYLALEVYTIFSAVSAMMNLNFLTTFQTIMIWIRLLYSESRSFPSGFLF